MSTNGVILYVVAIFLFGIAIIFSASAAPPQSEQRLRDFAIISSASAPPIQSEQKLLDLDSQTKAQIYKPAPPAQLPPPSSIPPFLQSMLLGSNNAYSSPALPLFFSPQFVNPLTKDIFSMANDVLNLFGGLFRLPPNMNYQDQINRVQELLSSGQIPEQYQRNAQAFLSLLRDQPILRALQESVSELGRSTSFNLSASGQGLNDLRLKTGFNLPSTMITPAIQSSFGISSNGNDVAADKVPARLRNGSKSNAGESDEEMDGIDLYLRDM